MKGLDTFSETYDDYLAWSAEFRPDPSTFVMWRTLEEHSRAITHIRDALTQFQAGDLSAEDFTLEASAILAGA